MKTIWRFLGVFALFTLLVSGCGGGGGSSDPTVSDPPPAGTSDPPNVTPPPVVPPPDTNPTTTVTPSPTDPPATPVAPAAPTQVTASGGTNQITVSWSTVAGATLYNLYWSTAAGVTTATGTRIAGISDPYIHTGLAANTTYYYVVTAVNGAGESPASSPVASAKTNPVPLVFSVDGIANRSVSDGTSLFVTTFRLQDVYLTKFSQSGNVIWEKTVLATPDYDECHGIALMGGFVYMLCVQDDPDPRWTGLPTNTGVVFLEKIDAASGAKVKESILINYGATLGLAADAAAHTIYACYSTGSGVDTIARLDANGTVTGSVTDSPGGGVGMFSGIMVASDDALYSVGSILQSAAYNRIKVIKYSKDLSSEIGSVQYRNFSDSDNIDWPRGAALSPDGNSLFVSGAIDILGSDNPRNVLLKVDVATGSLAANDLGLAGIGNTQPADLAFDASGMLYGILNGSVVKIDVSTMGVTPLGIGAKFLTLDASAARLYVSDETAGVAAYGLGGKPITLP